MSAVSRFFPDRTVRDVFVEKRFFPAGGEPEKTYLAYLKVEVRFRNADTVTAEAGTRESPFN